MEPPRDWADDEKLAAEAMARVAPEAAALPENDLRKVNLDLQQATGTLLGVLPRLMALREQFVKELPGFDIAQIDKLEDYALALRFAHAAYQTATQPRNALNDGAEEAVGLRERLLADARALSFHALIDPRKLESLKGANGMNNVAQDLQMLSQVLQESWPKIQGKTATVAEDLQAASRIATRVTRMVGAREQGSAPENAAHEQRERVFALTMRAYEETRVAVAYLRRRERDAESITPNLYTGKGRKRLTNKPAEDIPPTAVASTSTSTSTEWHAVAPGAVVAPVAQPGVNEPEPLAPPTNLDRGT